MNDVSILYCQRDSIYKSLGVDVWDDLRDARLWPGGNPVVAHPPCRLWSKMKTFSSAPVAEKELALHAIAMVRRWGGVLEHPKRSGLWPDLLVLPGRGRDPWGGYSLSIDQRWWGHKARKPTFIYIVGCPEKDLPPIPLNFDCIEYVLFDLSKKKGDPRKTISKRDRSASPIDFAKWLIEVARRCRV